MKVKGVGFFEAHVEKLLLGLMVAVAAGVVVLQFAGSPNAVTVGNQTLPPARAFDPVERKAQETAGRMDATNVDIPDVEGRDAALAGLEDRLRLPVSGDVRLLAFGKPAEIDDALLSGQAENVEYAVVSPPAPGEPTAATYAGTLDPALLVDNDELAALVGSSQPYDLVTVSVETTYDGTALEEAFRTAGAGEVRALPFNWVNSIEALGMQLERQERLDDGSWGNATIIEGLPGQPSLTQVLQEDAADGVLGRDQLASDARMAFEAAPDFRRPLPVRTIAGPEWKPPTVAKQELAAFGGSDRQAQAQQAFQRRGNELTRLEALQGQLREASSGQGGGERGDPRRGGARRPGGGGGDGDESPANDRRAQAIERQIAEIERRIERIDEEMIDLGYDPETGSPQEPGGFADQTIDNRLLASEEVRLWAHDVTAQPGATYRYRTRVAINNPMFGRDAVLIESQRPLAASPVIYSEPSPWSDPVVVAPMTAFFLANANDGRGGALGPSEPTASVEVFTFYYGYYRRATLTLRPGDLIATEADLPDDLRLPVLASVEGQDEPFGGDRRREAGRGAQRPGVPPSSAAPTSPGRSPGSEEPQDEAEGEPVPDEVPAVVDVYLVDVTFEPTQAEGPADRTTQAVAYFSQLSGTGLLRRVASTDRQGELYQLLSRSADEGQNQGQARASLEALPERPRDADDSRRPTSPGSGGKGLGGGGGGG